jgi:hypothetical protein
MFVRTLGGAVTAARSGAKDYARSKISVWNGETLIEDFLTLRRVEERGPYPEGPEMISRELDGDVLSYLYGGVSFWETTIPRAIGESILTEPGRKGVHELDKCVGLMGVFRGALEGKPEAYGYLDSVFDTTAAWWAGKRRVAPVW